MPILALFLGLTLSSAPELAANLGYETMAATAKRDARSAAGKIKPVIDCTMPLRDLKQAYARMGSRAVRGKLVLVP
mgnify:CR=1 FL=1